MTIQQLLAANTKVAGQSVTKPTKTRFMLELDNSIRNQLRDLCENKLGCKQIQFASDLFTVALTDALRAYEEATKKQ